LAALKSFEERDRSGMSGNESRGRGYVNRRERGAVGSCPESAGSVELQKPGANFSGMGLPVRASIPNERGTPLLSNPAQTPISDSMKSLLLCRTGHTLLVLATLMAFAGAPLDSEARADDPVKRVKVKDHKVKVKAVDGKAKIKDKPNGKYKVKLKGPNGDLAAGIAYAAANPFCEAAEAGYK